LPGPVQVFVGGLAVVVDIVFVADVERGIGECEVNAASREAVHAGDAVTEVEGVV